MLAFNPDQNYDASFGGGSSYFGGFGFDIAAPSRSFEASRKSADRCERTTAWAFHWQTLNHYPDCGKTKRAGT